VRLYRSQAPAVRLKYQIVDVVFTPVGRRIRYEIQSPLFCTRMNGPVVNRRTLTLNDQVFLWTFGSWSAVNRIWREGKPVRRTMRLSTLGYDPCDFAKEPAPSRRTSD
jgi:hypothetical protein